MKRLTIRVRKDTRVALPGQPDLQTVVRLCQVLRGDTKALVRANVNSWEIGRLLHPTRQ